MTTINIEPRYTFATRLQDEAIAQAEARERMDFARQQCINAICKGIRTLDGIESAEVVQVLCTLEVQMQAAGFSDGDRAAIQDVIGLLDVWRPEAA